MSESLVFSAWRGWFPRRPVVTVAATLTGLRRCTLDKMEERFASMLSGPGLIALSSAHAPRRERPYSVRRTTWVLLWQMLQANVTCRDVVRQIQAMQVLDGRAIVDEGNSGYCQARARVPEPLLRTALSVSAQAAADRVPQSAALQGRAIKVLDGTTLTLPDTPENQAAYPQTASQKPGCGFPQMNLLVRWNACGAAVLDFAAGDHHHGEMRLLHQLAPTFQPQDIVIYDRAAGHFVACAQLTARQVDLISRVSIRKIDWRRGQRLSHNERLVIWKKSGKTPAYLTAEEWAALPNEITVRVIRVRVQQKGFRARELALVTTLLEPSKYPAAEICAAYLRRWRLEMCLDDLKTTLGLDALRCKTPKTILRELLALFIVHNLVRAVMAEAAEAHAVPLDQISFTGTLVALRSFGAASAQAATAKQRHRLWTEMLRVIAADPLPLRPDRWEPRVVKRRPKAYSLLNRPRHEYREVRHGSLYRRPAKTARPATRTKQT